MSNDLDLFKGKEKFDLILKKIEEDNNKIFEDAKITSDECCMFFFNNNKISLGEVNSKLPTSIKNLIETKWKEFCDNHKE